jgi:hypothetical protein
VSGQLSDKPLAENGWGGFDPDAPLNYHDDGPIGTAVRAMGADARMDVDGEPLANVLGTLATDVVMGRATPQQSLDQVKTLRDRLPADSVARAVVEQAIGRMDAPPSPAPRLPDATPEPIRRLADQLHAIPMVRSDPSKELGPLTQLCDEFAAGQITRRGLAREVENLVNRRHESLGDTGKFTIDRAVLGAVRELRDQPTDTR